MSRNVTGTDHLQHSAIQVAFPNSTCMTLILYILFRFPDLLYDSKMMLSKSIYSTNNCRFGIMVDRLSIQ